MVGTDDTSKARDHKTFIAQALLMILTYHCRNIFIAEATGFSLLQEL
jgi:hypothetical protein